MARAARCCACCQSGDSSASPHRYLDGQHRADYVYVHGVLHSATSCRFRLQSQSWPLTAGCNRREVATAGWTPPVASLATARGLRDEERLVRPQVKRRSARPRRADATLLPACSSAQPVALADSMYCSRATAHRYRLKLAAIGRCQAGATPFHRTGGTFTTGYSIGSSAQQCRHGRLLLKRPWRKSRGAGIRTPAEPGHAGGVVFRQHPGKAGLHTATTLARQPFGAWRECALRTRLVSKGM